MTAMTEWKPIAGHPHYEVSNMGQVRSMPRVISRKNRWNPTETRPCKRAGITLKPHSAGQGYLAVPLGTNARQYVHRLVAEAFLPEDSNRRYINHKNGNKHDNRADNLERVTPSENMQHSTYVLGHRNGQFKQKLTDAQMAVMCDLVRTHKRRQRDVATQLGVSPRTVQRWLTKLSH